jgi:hypothetical protein
MELANCTQSVAVLWFGYDSTVSGCKESGGFEDIDGK